MRERLERVLMGAVLGVLALGFLSAGAWGATKAGSPPPPKIVSTVALNANNWEIWIDNRGRHTVPLPGSQPGGFWPKGTGRNYIFGGGIWVGQLTVTPSKTDTQVTWGYNPNSGGAEFCPTTPDGDETKYLDPSAKVYLSNNPNDVLSWPEKDAEGKKVIKSLQDSWTKFNDVNPTYMVGTDKPIGVEVKRITYAWPYPQYDNIVYFLFWVKNVTAKLGTAKTLNEVILGNCMDCDIGNESGTAANDYTYLNNSKYRRGLGDSITRNLAVQYQLAQETGWSIGPPYFVGFRFFQSPKNNTGRTLNIRSQPGIGYPEYDRDVLPDSLLGMTAFQLFTIAMDPSTPGQRYLELTGRYYGTPQIYNAYQYDDLGAGDKRFIQCSGPFNLAPDSVVPFVVGVMGGLDSIEIRKASDKAQDIFDSGFLAPFPPVAPNLTVIPGDRKVTLFWDYTAETTPDPYWALITDTTQRRRYRPYDLQGYKVYKARNVSDLSDMKKRFLLGQYDALDGFTVVRDAQDRIRELPGGGKETLQVWDTLGTDNGLRYSFVDSGQVVGDSIGVVNGIPYFYGVTGFDYQYYDSAGIRPGNPTTLEGSASEKYVIAVPRTNPGDMTLARIDSSSWQVHGGAYTSKLYYFPKVANPDTVTKYPNTYRYELLPIQRVPWAGTWGRYLPAYSLLIKDVTNNRYATAKKLRWPSDTILTTVVDTVILGIDTTYGTAGRITYTPGKSVMVNGIEFGLLDTINWFNFRSGTIAVSQGSFPETPLADTATNWSTSLPRFGFKVQNWAFRGSMFTLTWHKKRGTVRGDSIWADVRDSTNQVNVPPETLAVQDSAKVSGWCFGGNINNTTNQRGKLWIDSTMVRIIVGGTDTIPTQIRYPGTWLTLCGRRYWFAGNQGGYSGRPMLWPGGVCPINEGDVWIVQQQGFQVPCDGNWMQFRATGNQTVAGGKALLDAIKVVPNPYLVRNNWDVDKLDKHLMFTHLPTKCTIRIYTLAGDLVKIIYHDGSQNSFATMGGTTPMGGTGGVEFWNLLTYNDQLVASGMYLFHVEAPGIGNKIGKFAIIQ